MVVALCLLAVVMVAAIVGCIHALLMRWEQRLAGSIDRRLEKLATWTQVELHCDVLHNLQHRDTEAVRRDITELYAVLLELHPGILRRFGDLQHFIDEEFEQVRLAVGGNYEKLGGEQRRFEARLDIQLADLMKEVSDPTILRLMQAIALAFQVDTLEKLTADDGVTESTTEGSVGGPLVPHPVPNIGRKLEPARFSEETISAGMQELIDGAAARGITLSMADARKQAMLMLNDVEV